MSVQMELSRIIISEINDQQVVYLKEVEGDRTFPILIGLFEATSIDRRVKHHQSPRPLTHDLLVAAVVGSVVLTARNAHYRRITEEEQVDDDGDGIPDVYG